MAKKPTTRKFEHVGSQRVEYFREKPQPKKKFDWDALFGGPVPSVLRIGAARQLHELNSDHQSNGRLRAPFVVSSTGDFYDSSE